MIDTIFHTEREDELHYMPYSVYHKTPEWLATRERILLRDGYRCRLCGRDRACKDSQGRAIVLVVHHNSYDHRGYELDHELITLCKQEHDLFHAMNPDFPRSYGRPKKQRTIKRAEKRNTDPKTLPKMRMLF